MVKLLIIEDDPFMRSLYDNMFSLAGFEVVLANDGEQGVNMAKIALPKLILLDMMMPKMSGLEVLDHIKNEETTKHIPIAILSNLAEEEDKKRAFEKGAIAYIVKSEHEPADVVALIQQLLEKYPTT
ncbi:N/A [soil metagenome]